MSSPTPPATDPSAPAPSDRLWLRSELMGTQVITRDTGRRLGVVGEVVVDIDRREVVALGLRDNPLTRFLPGLPRWMPLASIRQVGDVILVDSADSLSETFNPERYSKVINCQVITESGVQLGRVLGFSFDIETGDLTTLVIGALGVPLLGEGVLSTWELAVGEIVSSGTDRIIVYEGAEEKLKQLGTGLLEKLGIGGSSWEEEERERFRSGMIPAENQLPAGTPSATEQRRIQPATSRAVQPESELDYVELEDRREREPLRQRLYLDEDEREEGRLRRQDPYGDESYASYGRRPYEGSDSDRRGGDRGDSDRYGRRLPDRSDPQDWQGPSEERSFRERDEPSSLRGRADESPLREPGPWPAREEAMPWSGQERDSVVRSRSAGGPDRDTRDAGSSDAAGDTTLWRGQRDQSEPRSLEQPMTGIRDTPGEARADQDPGRAAWQGRDPEPRSISQPMAAPGAMQSAPSTTSSGSPWGSRETGRQSNRPAAERRGPPEPIDVEPEVLDDPW